MTDNPTPQPQDELPTYLPEDLIMAKEALDNMTPEQYLDHLAYLKAVKTQTGDGIALNKLPEAGGFAFADLVSKTGVRIHFGDRDVSSQAASQRLFATVKWLLAQGFTPDQPPPTPPAPKPPAPAPAAKPAPAPAPATKPAPVKPAPARPAPAAPADQATPNTSFTCVQLTVQPRPGDKVELQFFGNLRKTPVDDYPEVKKVCSYPDALALLAETGDWDDEAALRVAETYGVSYGVEYKQGRQIPGSTNYYKDIVRVWPL